LSELLTHFNGLAASCLSISSCARRRVTPLEYDESVLPYPQHDLEQPEGEIIINVVTPRANVSQDGWSDILRRRSRLPVRAGSRFPSPRAPSGPCAGCGSIVAAAAQQPCSSGFPGQADCGRSRIGKTGTRQRCADCKASVAKGTRSRAAAAAPESLEAKATGPREIKRLIV
jgi:hypothetical protein